MSHYELSPVAAVAFDLDGLMFNTEEIYVHVATELLARRGHELDMGLLHAMMGQPARVSLPMMIAHYRLTETPDELQQETQAIFDDLLPSRLRPMSGLLELLQRVDELGLPKAIATSSGRNYLSRVLRLAELPFEFDFMLTAEDVVHGKPHPEIYQRSAARFGVDPARMLVLEDSENGCRAGVASGAKTVAVPGPHNPASEYVGVVLKANTLADPRVWALLGDR